jgi:hypothetical protein
VIVRKTFFSTTFGEVAVSCGLARAGRSTLLTAGRARGKSQQKGAEVAKKRDEGKGQKKWVAQKWTSDDEEWWPQLFDSAPLDVAPFDMLKTGGAGTAGKARCCAKHEKRRMKAMNRRARR